MDLAHCLEVSLVPGMTNQQMNRRVDAKWNGPSITKNDPDPQPTFMASPNTDSEPLNTNPLQAHSTSHIRPIIKSCIFEAMDRLAIRLTRDDAQKRELEDSLDLA